MKALDVQVGGDHYKRMAIQPAEYNIKNGLSFAAGNVVKYVTRYQFKNGMEDLLKAKHYLEMLIEHENDRTGNVNQPQPTGSDSPQAGGAGDYTDQGGSEPASESDPGDGRQGDDKIEMRYRELFYKALSSVDRVFQLCTENPTPLLPDFVPAGGDKFEAVVTLAEEYIKHTKALEDILRSCDRHAKDIASNRLANSLYRCDSDEVVPDGNSGDLREGDVVYIKPGYKLKNDDYQRYSRHFGFVSGRIDRTTALETVGVTVHDNEKGFRVAIRVPCAVIEKNIFNA